MNWIKNNFSSFFVSTLSTLAAITIPAIIVIYKNTELNTEMTSMLSINLREIAQNITIISEQQKLNTHTISFIIEAHKELNTSINDIKIHLTQITTKNEADKEYMKFFMDAAIKQMEYNLNLFIQKQNKINAGFTKQVENYEQELYDLGMQLKTLNEKYTSLIKNEN